MVNLLAMSHMLILSNSIFNDFIKLSILLSSRKTLVSSANNTENNLSEASDRSFTYKMNSNGPRTEPCGIPQVAIPVLDFELFMYTYCFLLLK